MSIEQLSVQQYIDSCIVKELESKFEVRYSDTMYVHRPCYTSAKTVITKNGYSLKTSDEGYQLKGSETTQVKAEEINLGIWSSSFLNMRVYQDVAGVMPYVVGFSIANAKSKQGELARSSGRLMEEQESKKLTAEQSDVTALSLFSSTEVTADGKEGLYQFDGAELLPRDDFQEEEEDRTIISFADSDEPDAPFYYRINMKRRGRVYEKLPKSWEDAIAKEGLSWSYDMNTGILYVSNTKGAAYGLPPNPVVMKMGSLGLELQDWPETAQKTVPLAGTGKAKGTGDPMHGQEVVEQFLHNPDEATYREMVADDGVRELFKSYKDNVRYKLGTNSNKLTTALRKKMTGEENARTWSEFSELIQTVACPKDTIACALLVVKNLSVLRVTEGGLVYYEE